MHKTIAYTYLNNIDEVKIEESNPQKADQKETCVYDDYNPQGDWTKLYCLDENDVITKFNLRTIEYY